MPVITMANTGLFARALRINGWDGIGPSFIFIIFIFYKGKYEKPLRILFIVNGIPSCLLLLKTSINMNWLFSYA
jgi:hypothetical protein